MMRGGVYWIGAARREGRLLARWTKKEMVI
jgi:hypothetical protein